MTVLAVDASKFTVSPPPIDAWKANGVELVIIQAHPAQYGQERSLELMRAVSAAGLPWDAYIYQYLAFLDWLPGALETLDLAAAEGLVPRKGWLDVEDNSASAGGLSVTRRIGAVQRDLDLLDGWLSAHERPPAGIYSADWYWPAWMANTSRFNDRQLWAAQYDGNPDTTNVVLFGGWAECRIKQYAGSQPDGTDLDSLSDVEAEELTGGNDVTDPEREAMQNQINGLVSSLGYIAGDLLSPVASQKTGTKAVKNLVTGIRSQADAHGIAHA